MTDVTFTIKIAGDGRGGEQAIQRVVQRLKEMGAAQRTTAAGGTALTQSVAAVRQGVSSAIRSVVAYTLALVGTRALARLVSDQLKAADAVGKLSQALGIGTEALSVFQFAARNADVSNEELTAGFRTLAKAQQEALKPGSEAAASLKALGISAQDFAALPLEKAFLKLANAQAEFGASGAKATALAQLLGSRGVVPLIPLLNDLAGDGFAKATAEAKRLGLVFSEEMTASAAKFQDSLDRLKGAARGLAGEFAAGFAPGAVEAFDRLTAAASESGSAIRTLGSLFAGSVNDASKLAVQLNLVQELLVKFGRKPGGFFNLTNVLGFQKELHVRISNILPDQAEIDKDVSARQRSLVSRLQRFQKTVLDSIATFPEAVRAKLTELATTPLAALSVPELQRFQAELVTAVKPPKDFDGPDAGAAAAAQAAAEARIAAVVDGIQAEFALKKVGFDREAAQADEARRVGLSSLKDFMAERRRIIAAEADAEVQALEGQAAAVAKRPVQTPAERITRDADVEKLRDQIALRRAQQAKDQEDATRQETLLQEDLGKAQLALQDRLLEAQGRTAAAAIAALRQQMAEVRKGLGADITPAQEADLGAIEEVETAKIQFQELQAAAERVFATLEQEQTRIGALVAAGAITEVEGQRQILALQEARLPVLAQMREQLSAIATVIKDPDVQAALEAMIAQMDLLAITVEGAKNQMSDFGKGLKEGFEGALTQFLGSAINDVHSLGEAFTTFGRLAVSALQQVIAKLIVAVALQALLDALAIGAAGAEKGGLVTVLPEPTRAASGGYVVGPRHSGGGKRIEVEGGEYIIRRTAVQRVGIDFLDLINRAGIGRPVVLANRSRRYAEGGLVEPGAGKPDDAADRRGEMSAFEFRLEPGLVAKQIETGPVKRAIIRLINDNPKALGRT